MDFLQPLIHGPASYDDGGAHAPFDQHGFFEATPPQSRSSLPARSQSPVSFHPLQHSWTLWFFKNDKTRPWEENQVEIFTFNSVEQFWALYNKVELASKLPVGCDYSLFKSGIKPMWEDKHNCEGGRWLLPLNKTRHRLASELIDNYWLEVMMCLIGEAFGPEFGPVVNGAVISIRGKGDKIGLWVGDCNETKMVVNVGMTLKERLNLGERTPIGFDPHRETMRKAGSNVRHLYRL